MTPSKSKPSTVVEASPTVTQFAQNPYMELKPKPSDTPNTFFSMLTQHNKNSSSQSSNIKSMPSMKQAPLTQRQTTFQTFYESITQPLFGAATGTYANSG